MKPESGQKSEPNEVCWIGTDGHVWAMGKDGKQRRISEPIIPRKQDEK